MQTKLYNFIAPAKLGKLASVKNNGQIEEQYKSLIEQSFI